MRQIDAAPVIDMAITIVQSFGRNTLNINQKIASFSSLEISTDAIPSASSRNGILRDV
jgi:hypothetical protein